MQQTVRVEDGGGIRTVTLVRAERRNALVPEMQEEIIAAFHGAEHAGARVVMLRGEGEAFCAGLDLNVLKEMIGLTRAQHHAAADLVARMFAAVWECPVPTIAVVQRAAIAGGTGLAMLCDYTLAGPEASFGFTEARIGFVPAVVGAYLMALIGDKAARGLLLSARKFTAEEALRVGIVNELVEQDQVEARARSLAGELMHNSPESLRATKAMLRSMQAPFLEHALKIATEMNAASRETADFREGITAFVEKRKPYWVVEAEETPHG